MLTHRISLLALVLLGASWATPRLHSSVDAGTLPGALHAMDLSLTTMATSSVPAMTLADHVVAFRKLAGQSKTLLPGLAAGKSCSAYDLNNGGCLWGVRRRGW